MGTADACEDGSEQVPSIRNILLLRKLGNQQVNESYVYFCQKYLKCVVGVQAFNRGVKNKLDISQIATSSDEALALLLLENSELRWTVEYQQKASNSVNEEQLPKTKYTCCGQKKLQKGFTRKYGGWKQEGIDRFNELTKLVRVDRKNNGVAFDKTYKGRQSNDDDDGDNGIAAPLAYTVAANDLFLMKKPKAKVSTWRSDEDDGDDDYDGGVDEDEDGGNDYDEHQQYEDDDEQVDTVPV